jgi:subtilisin family serine protease
MRRIVLHLLLLALVATEGYSRATISGRLAYELARAGAQGGTVRTLVLLADRIDINALDQTLYAQDISLQDRARIVITTLQAKADQTQGPVLDYLASFDASNVAEVKTYWITNLLFVEATPSVIQQLAERSDIEYIDMDALLLRDEPVEILPTEASPNGSEIGLRDINAHRMWAAGYTGAGRIVMNIDTGVNGGHVAINYKWRGTHVPAAQAWFDPNTGTQTPTDCDGHGTHTIGTMCGLATGTNDTIGVAPGAEWIAAKTLCTFNHTSASISAFQWAMDPDGNPNTITDMPDAISNSWTDPNVQDCANSVYKPVLDAVEASGIAVVFSAGNSGPGVSTITVPKNINTNEVNIFATGAIDGNNLSFPIASFSSRGPSDCGGVGSLNIKPEACAPGVSVRSSYGTSGSNYSLLSGTSMACPHVAGAIALLKQAHPTMTGFELKMALYNTARDLGTTGEDNTYGKGIIDVYAAHLSLSGTTNQPPVVTDIPNQTVTLGGRFTAIRVDNFVSDPDNADNELTWSWSGNSSLTVVWNATRRRITVRAPNGWTGSETITFTATDPGGATDSDPATFTVNPAGTLTITAAGDPQELEGYNEPAETALVGNFPNPFNPSTLIRYTVGEDSWVTLKVYNTMGQEVATLVDGFQHAGNGSAVWEGKNSVGEHVASGIYFYKLTAGNVVSVNKMMFVK